MAGSRFFRLLLAGMAVSFILTAISNFILMMSKQEGALKAVMFWMLGSLAGAKWSNIIIPASIFFIVFALLWLFYRNLNLLLLGEEAAVTLGVNLQQFRIQLILLVSLLTGGTCSSQWFYRICGINYSAYSTVNCRF
ncbi:iron ABC transporter permease [Lysinibacillus sp. MHQ-1]|nr:iron ABC transporter permease [Lysinibacillus sp. MHQ-1]